jgi:hypothetical protein
MAKTGLKLSPEWGKVDKRIERLPELLTRAAKRTIQAEAKHLQDEIRRAITEAPFAGSVPGADDPITRGRVMATQIVVVVKDDRVTVGVNVKWAELRDVLSRGSFKDLSKEQRRFVFGTMLRNQVKDRVKFIDIATISPEPHIGPAIEKAWGGNGAETRMRATWDQELGKMFK